MLFPSTFLLLKIFYQGLRMTQVYFYNIHTHVSSIPPKSIFTFYTFKFVSYFLTSLSLVCLVHIFLSMQQSLGSWMIYKKLCSLIKLTFPFLVVIIFWECIIQKWDFMCTCSIYAVFVFFLCVCFLFVCLISWLEFEQVFCMLSYNREYVCDWPVKSRNHCVLEIHCLKLLQSCYLLS